MDSLLLCVYASPEGIPGSLRILFKHIFAECKNNFPDVPFIGYVGISVFFFLRFISAAILGPKLFRLADSTLFPFSILWSSLLVFPFSLLTFKRFPRSSGCKKFGCAVKYSDKNSEHGELRK